MRLREGLKISINENILDIKNNIENVLAKYGRNPKDITLIGVTKTIDVDRIKEAINFGIKDIGENKVQEIETKYNNIENEVNWHMIGHLQSNKVKYIIDKVHLIHSLDRLSLAEEIQKRASYKGIIIDTLVQVNIAEEESKFGLMYEQVIPFIEKVKDYENIRIKGLMTVAPYAENPEEVRYVFRRLKELYDKIGAKNYKNVEMKHLSMGMTNDYKVALEEGSNMIRIGTAIFGKRIYKEE